MIVCHPGGPGGSSAFFEDLGGVERERTLILLNPRGTGGSDLPADPEAYRLEDYADDLEELRAHLGLEQLDLLGHSAGGFVSVVYAAAYPHRVRRLLLVGSLPRFSDEWREDAQRKWDRKARDPDFSEAISARRARDGNPPASDDALAAAVLRELPIHFGHYGAEEEAFLERLRSSATPFNAASLRFFNERVAPTFDLRPQLARITAPTLVVAGELDAGGEIAAAEFAAHLAACRVVVLEDVGHIQWHEAPDAFREAVLSFLE
jgi:pimeloyl-ACP methyl ester carboxylesterase